MKYNDLLVKGNKNTSRKGRGISAGRGKTAGRGTKGQKSRTGSKRRPGFEGGQTPLMQRLPKLPGFRSNRTKKEVVYTGQINKVGPIVNNSTLFKAKLISSPNVNVKVIQKGELNTKMSVELQASSDKAIESIKKAGGSFNKITRIKRIAKKQS